MIIPAIKAVVIELLREHHYTVMEYNEITVDVIAWPSHCERRLCSLEFRDAYILVDAWLPVKLSYGTEQILSFGPAQILSQERIYYVDKTLDKHLLNLINHIKVMLTDAVPKGMGTG